MKELDKDDRYNKLITPHELDAYRFISNSNDRFNFVELDETRKKITAKPTDDSFVIQEEPEKTEKFKLIEEYAQQSCDFSEYAEVHDQIFDFEDAKANQTDLIVDEKSNVDQQSATVFKQENVKTDYELRIDKEFKEETPKSTVITWNSFPKNG